MSRSKIRCLALILEIVSVTVLAVPCAYAQSNSFDLLFGLGDFEKCTYSRVLGLDSFGMVPTSDLTVANGWTAAIDVSNASSYVCRLVSSDTYTDDGYQYMDKGKSYQYIGIKNSPGSTQNAQLYVSIVSSASNADDTFHAGDTLVFHLDKIISSNFIPGHQVVSIFMFYTLNDKTGHRESIDVDLSRGYKTNVEFGPDVPNVKSVKPCIQLYIGANTTPGKTTGILLSGARIYVKRNGTNVVDETAPYTRNRSIQTNTDLWDSTTLPQRTAARSFDYITTGASGYPYFSILRKLNPGVKIFIYQGGTTANDIASDPTRAVRWCPTPFKMDYVIANHPNWLWPQTKPKAANDPDKGDSIYVAQYCNAGGYADRYWISRIVDKTYQDKWASDVIQLAKSVAADGVFIDDTGILIGETEDDGVWRYMWEVQQFLHAVVSRLKASGLTVVVNHATSNLDGSASWNGDLPEVYWNPVWKPTSALPESAGYSANTIDNTPDVLYRQYSFIRNDFGYDSSYWLRCINDAKIVSAWNVSLPSAKAKRIQYAVEEHDTASNPAYDQGGKPGWIPFGLASFLLCSNEFVSLGFTMVGSDGTLHDPMVDCSITKKLGIPDGDDTPIDNHKYFRKRSYKASGADSYGGVVVANGDTKQSYDFVVPFNAIDDSGNVYPAGTKISFLPNMGKILLAATANPNVSVEVIVPTTSVSPGQTVALTIEIHEQRDRRGKERSVARVRPCWDAVCGR